MALRLRKDIKKSSYYVWFLGAKESQGLRGEEYIVPVVKHLIEREKDIEPFKVTLQVSHKGLKIIQNIVTTSVKNSKPKNETIKHFIPHNTITCVLQNEDIVACILLLFNPVTKCPLHVHAYRCDSLETAALLKSQLQILIERPENQKKFTEFEQKLKVKLPVPSNKDTKFKKRFDSSLGSDTGTSTRESESSEERYTNDNRIATLYDSLAAELRQKLGKNDPILLPPRDYDTVHRQKGNLEGIDMRRSLNTNIVGLNAKNISGTSNGRRGLESSGGSSGIGSDHAPSPDAAGKEESTLITHQTDSRYNTMDNQSSSDEDWNHDPIESTIYLMHGPSTEPLPRIRSAHSDLNRSSDPPSPHRPIDRVHSLSNERESERKMAENSLKTQSRYSSTERTAKYIENDAMYNENGKYPSSNQSYESKSKYYDPNSKYVPEKGSNKNSSKYNDPLAARYPAGFAQNGSKYRNSYECPEPKYPDEGYRNNDRSLNRSSDKNSKYSNSSPKSSDRYASKTKYSDQRYSPEKYIEDTKNGNEEYDDCPRYFDGASPRALRRRAENRQRSPSPNRKLKVDIEKAKENTIDSGNSTSPRDRFKDAKEKFLLLEKQRLEEQERLAAVRRSQEKPISPVNMRRVPRNWDEDIRDKNFLKRHDSSAYETNGVYSEKDDMYYDENPRLEDRYREENRNHQEYSRKHEDIRKYQEDTRKYHEDSRKHVEEPRKHSDDSRKYQENNRKYQEEPRKHSGDSRKYPEESRKYPEESKKYQKDVDMPVRNEKDKYFSRYDTENSIPRYNKDHPKYVEDTKVPSSRYEREFTESKSRYIDDKSKYTDKEASRTLKEDKSRYHDDKLRYQDDKRRYPDDARYNEEIRLENIRNKTPERYFPKPAPRNIPTESYRDNFEVPLERYRSPERYQNDSKRRSMYNAIEDEHKRNSNEIAKELKRRSYMETQDRYYDDERYYRNEKSSNGRYVELNDHERYPGLDRDDCRLSKSTVDLDKSGRKLSPKELTKSTHELDQQGHDSKFSKTQQKVIKNSAGYRHSYAEPKLRLERMGGKKLFPDILHRTNSTVSNSGRVGIASIHPY